MAKGVRDTSRNGAVIVAPGPVIIAYKKPQERVLLGHEKRNANPFLHLMEALWMLAGRRDAAFLAQFTQQIMQYAEDDGNFHGAYGYRWRKHFELEGGGGLVDQIGTIITMLREDPRNRRVVLQMWDPLADLGTSYKDLPCNISVLPRIVDGKLDITVINRSNDAIWGAFGSNQVTFSVLQEYLAAFIGVGVGTYYQISNNFHAYEAVLQKHWPVDNAPDYYINGVKTQPLVTNPAAFDDELCHFLEVVETAVSLNIRLPRFANSFLKETAWPMMQAHRLWKEGNKVAAMGKATYIEADDWRMAVIDWFNWRGGAK
jgi:hypothetical protein